MPRNDLIAFVDLETTGSDRELDDIIEVGIALYDWPDFSERAALSYLIEPSDAAYRRMMDNAVVKDMHEKNGLLDDLHRLMSKYPGLGTPEKIDSTIDEFLSEFGTRNSPHIPLAGSGVCHFDRPFIKKSLPLFDQRLSYWSYDVGVLRRMFILAGAKHPPEDTKTHRALDDARQAAEEFKFYMDKITQMFGSLRAEADAAKE